MPDYDFKTLSPYDFEDLTRDLLQCDLGIRLQSFRRGRDQGVDLRYAPAAGADLVVQCKHYANSTFQDLHRRIRSDELSKVERLAPARYILATSLSLSVAQVNTLYGLLERFCASRQDVLGRDDLNNLLGRFPQIEQRNFKLWLTSMAVLERIVHNPAFVQTHLTKEAIERKMMLYVATQSVNRAQDILDANHCCIITGIPGIGKTTLAEILLADYLAHDWEIVTISQNLCEALHPASVNPELKQVFYYDDFLGQISLGDKLGKNEDRAILELLQTVRRSANKRFLLTTREYILAQAQRNYEYLSRADLQLDKCVLTLDDYTDIDKAKILANHLYFCGVPPTHISALIADKVYRKIISHRNYVPRLIESMTESRRLRAIPAEAYPDAFLHTLEHPSELWAHAFDNQLSQAARHLLLTLGSLGKEVTLQDLERAFDAFFASRARKYGFARDPSDYRHSLAELESSFINIAKFPSMTTISFNNASVMDFLSDRFRATEHDVSELLTSALFFEQVQCIVNIITGATWEQQAFAAFAEDPTILAGAFLRTLEAPSATIYTTHQLRTRDPMRLNPSALSRLEYGVRLADCCPSAELRDAILNRIDIILTNLNVEKPSITGLVRLLDAAEAAHWITHQDKHRLLLNARDYVVGEPTEFDEAVAASLWTAAHKTLFPADKLEDVLDGIGSLLFDHTYDVLASDDDPGTLREMVDDLSRVELKLGLDVDAERDALWQRITELEGSEDMADDDHWRLPTRSEPAESSASSIDAIFDSLRE